VRLFGLLGSGDSGNDASMETVLAYLREAPPRAVVDALCGDPNGPLQRDDDALHPVLVDNGYRVRLFGGDNKFDGEIAEKILADLPNLEPSRVTLASFSSYPELIREMRPVGMVVVTRYHNLMCALKLCKPTISLGYSRKFISLMADMGLAELHHFADSPNVGRLIEQFKELESRRAELQQQMAERNAAHKQSLADQFAMLPGCPCRAASQRMPELPRTGSPEAGSARAHGSYLRRGLAASS
jgi:polysaccharide pyruvyl transferase WcaK-like protein